MGMDNIWVPMANNLTCPYIPDEVFESGGVETRGEVIDGDAFPALFEWVIGYEAHGMPVVGKPVYPAAGVDAIGIGNEAESHECHSLSIEAFEAKPGSVFCVGRG